MRAELYLIATLVALLLGLLIGKSWERYKLRDGRWLDRRKLRDTPHYMLGLNLLADNQIDRAIDELTKAANADAGAIEIQMILGNLLRQKGQVGRAINIHQALLQRPGLTTAERAYGLLCLGLDFRHGGFVDRAVEAFQEVLRLDSWNRYALVNLQKLHEEQHQWSAAIQTREIIASIDAGDGSANHLILGFLHNELGSKELQLGHITAAAQSFEMAIHTDPRTLPAYLNLGDLRREQGDLDGAVRAWEQMVQASSERAYLAFGRLANAYATLGTPRRFTDLCRRLIDGNAQDWRARLALARHLTEAGDPRGAFDLLLEGLPYNPHNLGIHQELWRSLSSLDFSAALVDRYVALTREAVFYLDPHVCVSCRYRSTELLWQCPQCHEWNTFVEERIAPAKSPAAVDEAAR